MNSKLKAMRVEGPDLIKPISQKRMKKILSNELFCVDNFHDYSCSTIFTILQFLVTMYQPLSHISMPKINALDRICKLASESSITKILNLQKNIFYSKDSHPTRLHSTWSQVVGGDN